MMLQTSTARVAIPDGVLVNLGSGPECPAGWVCFDGSWQARLAGRPAAAWIAARLTGRAVGHWAKGIRCRDLRRGIDLPDASAALVYSSHFLEHLHREDALLLLRDVVRVLKPGGVCRVVTPDLAAAVDRYVAARRTAPGAADALQDALLLRGRASAAGRGLLASYRRGTDFDSHKWVYDGPSLCAMFAEAGFPSPAIRGYLDSDVSGDVLRQVEHPSRVVGGAGVCVEARKGPA